MNLDPDRRQKQSYESGLSGLDLDPGSNLGPDL
jgi:hypothetical protein